MPFWVLNALPHAWTISTKDFFLSMKYTLSIMGTSTPSVRHLAFDMTEYSVFLNLLSIWSREPESSWQLMLSIKRLSSVMCSLNSRITSESEISLPFSATKSLAFLIEEWKDIVFLMGNSPIAFASNIFEYRISAVVVFSLLSKSPTEMCLFSAM